MFHKSQSVLIALAILLAACGPAVTPALIPTRLPTSAPTSVPPVVPTAAPTALPTPAPMVLTDGLGHSITLSIIPRRIVSIAPSNTELLFAVGAGDQVVGREELSDYPDAAKKVASIGSVFGKINTEAIVALKPDLILAAEINPPEQVKTLQDLGLTVYYLSNPKDFDDLYANIKLVGQLTGLMQDGVADADLADIVEKCASFQGLELWTV